MIIMKKWLIGCLLFFCMHLPTAYGAEEIVIPNTSVQEIQTFLAKQAKEINAVVRERNDAFMIIHLQPDDEIFPSLWGKNAYLRCLYRFYPQGSDTRITYETQAVNGAQLASFTEARLGDYHGDRLVFARSRLISNAKSLTGIRTYFDGAYLYGVILALKDGDTVKIADVLPDSPCAKAGLSKGDQVLRFAGLSTAHATNFELFYQYIKCELAAQPLTLTILRDGKPQTITVAPLRCTAKEYAVWEKRFFTEDNKEES